MRFLAIPEPTRLERLAPPASRVTMVLDTDTYNEIDDQFAVVYALLSAEELDVQAVYAAPFHNNRSEGPADGMEKSYQEMLRLLDRLDISVDGFVFRGSTGFLADWDHPRQSEAAMDLVERAMSTSADLLYVVAIGAITNVASAILIEPQIIDRIIVVWLAGNPLYWRDTNVFNVNQDLHASRLIFDCGVPLVHIPCFGVTSHLLTTVPEIERYVQGRGAIGDYLAETFKAYSADHYAWSKEIWDISAIAYLVNPDWVPTEVVHSPILTNHMTWSFDLSRHMMRSATFVKRDPIFRDLFTKLESYTIGQTR